MHIEHEFVFRIQPIYVGYELRMEAIKRSVLYASTCTQSPSIAQKVGAARAQKGVARGAPLIGQEGVEHT